MTAEAIADLVATPADLAVYDTDAQAAEASLRLDASRLAELADGGFPHRRAADGTPLFDFTDLTNVALASGSGESIPELARRFLLRFVESPLAASVEPREWRLSVRPPGGDGAAGGEMLVALPDAGAAGVELLEIDVPRERASVAGGYTAVARLEGRVDSISSSAARAAYERVAEALVDGSIRYQNVADALRADHERAWRLGVADCFVASRLLADRLRSAGFEARVRRGFLLGLLGSDHTWCELREDGRWKPLDAVFAHHATVRGHDDVAAVCGGTRFNRLLPCRVADGSPVLSLADGSPAPPWCFAAVSARPAAVA